MAVTEFTVRHPSVRPRWRSEMITTTTASQAA